MSKKIYVVLYRPHERAGYMPLAAFVNRHKAKESCKNEMTTATINYEPFIFAEIELIE